MRPDISRFAERMDRQMVEAAERKGDRGWRTAGVLDLISAARRHETAAKDALAKLKSLSGAGRVSPEHEVHLRAHIAHEAADVANYFMMVADNASMGRELWTDRREEIPG